MMPYLKMQIDTPEEIIFFVSNIIVALCVFLILIAVLIDFVEFQKRKEVKKEKKSIVETGTMLVFLFFFYFLVKFQIGQINFIPFFLKVILAISGLIVLAIGCYINIIGRLNLGKNWSNQIKIYQDHSFISSGVYRFVRHPLYASIIWMFFGASLIYSNYLAFFANAFIFIPFMYYRGKQEESMLIKEFEDYKNYQMKVGMFFPKLFSKK